MSCAEGVGERGFDNYVTIPEVSAETILEVLFH